MDADCKEERPPHPRANASVFEILTCGWIIDLFKTGRKRDLEVKDLYETLNTHSSSLLGNILAKKWKVELFKAKKENRQPSLIRALIGMFGPRLMFWGLFRLIVEIVYSVYQPYFLGRVISEFDPDTPSDKLTNLGIFYCVGLIVISAAKNFCITVYTMTNLHLGMKVRVATCFLIYNKMDFQLVNAQRIALLSYNVSMFDTIKSVGAGLAEQNLLNNKAVRLSKTAIGETTIGHMVNILSNDVSRFDSAIILLPYVFVGPITTLVSAYFLWQQIGVSSLYGIAALIVFIPLQGWLGRKAAELRLKTAVRTDERIRLMNEIITGIQVIKMYTWEKSFARLVQRARENEIQYIKGSTCIRAILDSFVGFHTRIALFFSILSYVLLGNFITAQKVFIVTSYYNILLITMTLYLPQSIGKIGELLISIKRLREFLLYEEKSDQIGYHSTYDNNITSCYEKSTGIFISNVTAKWTRTQGNNTLENISLDVRPGRLVAIIGPVGAGKSSLLHVILRELPLSGGDIAVRGVVSYASQEPWLFSSSVQQNILFGSPMDRKRYRKVIRLCALKPDLIRFPNGDKTIVGERGISLSGGQKARINLARAVYKQADIYLLDDPLSAVDTHVGKHLFEKCIRGFLKEKICILITHQLQYLSKVDQIVLIENAKIIAKGSYEELQTSGLDFTNLLGHSTESPASSDVEHNLKDLSSISKNPSFNSSRTPCMRTHSICSSTEEEETELLKKDPNKVSETRTAGDVSVTVYSSYFAASGSRLKISFFLFTCIVTQVFASGGDYWMAIWVNLEENVFHRPHRAVVHDHNASATTNDISNTAFSWFVSRQTCIVVFSILTCSVVIAIIVRTATFVSMCTQVSKLLHEKMFNAITRATMYFFNSNPSGRILNRFSKDMGAIDELLPPVLLDCIQIGFTTLGTVIVIGIINIYLMIPLIVCGVIIHMFKTYYLSTSRSIKRLEGVTRSPVFTHLNASLQGLTTIRAFRAEQTLSNEFDSHQDLHSTACYLFFSSNIAFGIWVDLVCVMYVSVVIFSFFFSDSANMGGGSVGLAITQAIGFIGWFQTGVRQSAELENQMTSVERVLEYTDVTQEPALKSPLNEKPPKQWPHKGKIEFKNFYLRYSPTAPDVLKNLNIKIKSTEKIGIVGRTGAGKSSLIAALFRLACNKGSILIDDLNINKLGLHELRSKISIIPQEPILFSGTMRANLDPFDEYSDIVLWNVLDEVKLKNVIQKLPHGLNSRISEGGSNLSVGQRQLVCLARAIVRSNKILILDEATANVDAQTDELIQNTIRCKFKACTVLTIAHRLNTVMDSDRVLIIDAGEVVEFDHPYNLLKNKDGILYKMVKRTGRSTSDSLRNVAIESYRTIQATRKRKNSEQIGYSSIALI